MPTKPAAELGTITGEVVDRIGLVQPSLGRIYLMYETGQQTGRYVPVDPAGRFTFTDVAPGKWQLRFHAPGAAYVPEDLPHPLRLTVAANETTEARIVVERGWEDGEPMIEIYVGDFFFQEQPAGIENGTAVVKVGTPICWYNVGLVQHTTTGARWNSGPMDRTASFIWAADRAGVFPYTCSFHGSSMIATVRVEP